MNDWISKMFLAAAWCVLYVLLNFRNVFQCELNAQTLYSCVYIYKNFRKKICSLSQFLLIQPVMDHDEDNDEQYLFESFSRFAHFSLQLILMNKKIAKRI